jgi:hypothetical protein
VSATGAYRISRIAAAGAAVVASGVGPGAALLGETDGSTASAASTTMRGLRTRSG